MTAPVARADAGVSDPGHVLEKARAENFPVALGVLPRALRTDLLAAYGFARLADDLADEAPGDREPLLDELERDLDRAFCGTARHPLLQRLSFTLRERRLSREPFAALIEAGRQDQRVLRYESWNQLLGYCALSANPVGRIVLEIGGMATPDRVLLSDSICTALQIAEHCQDVVEDWERGRIYLPAQERRAAGCRDADLGRAPSPEPVRAVVLRCADRARGLLADGAPLVTRLTGGLRLAVAGFAAGGFATVDAIARAGGEVGSRHRGPRRRGILWHAVRILAARAGR